MLRPSEDRLAAGTPRATGALLVRLLLLPTAAFFSVRLLPAVLSYVCLCGHARLSLSQSCCFHASVCVPTLRAGRILRYMVPSGEYAAVLPLFVMFFTRRAKSLLDSSFVPYAFLFDAPCVVLPPFLMYFTRRARSPVDCSFVLSCFLV